MRRKTHSSRATAALAVGVGAFLIALAALGVAGLALLKASRPPVPMVSSGQLESVWKDRYEPRLEASEAARGERPWYGLCARYAVNSVEDFRREVAAQPLLTRHFADFDWGSARLLALDQTLTSHVSYVTDDRIAWTRGRLTLKAGETVITDGATTVRTFCCNEITDAPPPFTLTDDAAPFPEDLEPDEEEIAGSIPPAGGERWAARSGGSGHLPEPGTWLLTGTGLVALGGWRAARRWGRSRPPEGRR